MANANGIQTEDETTNMIMPTTNASVGISNGARVYMRFVASIASLQSPYSGTYTSISRPFLTVAPFCAHSAMNVVVAGLYIRSMHT